MTTETHFTESGGSPPNEANTHKDNSASSASEASTRAGGAPSDANTHARATPSSPDTLPQTQSLLTAEEVAELQAHELSLNGSDFIQGWMDYGTSRTDATPKFHEVIAYGLVAVAIDRNRHLPLRHKDVRPGIFSIAIAPSGKRKSTPFGYGEAVALSAFPDRVLGNDYSPEALLSDLASTITTPSGDDHPRDASRGVLFIDEAGRLLTTMRRAGYGEALKDVFSMVWDAPEERSRKLQKAKYTLKSIYVNLLMATTDTRFAETLTPEDITSGFLARFLPVVANESMPRKPLGRRDVSVDSAERNLIEALRNMRARLAKVVSRVVWKREMAHSSSGRS